jgi:hypothetical protein
MRLTVVALLLVISCARSREPLRIGVKPGDAAVAAGCSVVRPFRSGDTVSLDRALRDGAIDLYVESHTAALTLVLRKKAQPGPAAESQVRAAYMREDLLWAPMLGRGDAAVVFRKDVDQRCRAASRALMVAPAAGGPPRGGA